MHASSRFRQAACAGTALRLATLPLALICAVSPAAHAQDRGAEVRDAYHAAAAAEDADALVQVWKDNPARILVTIDADLEGSLSLREKAEAAGEPVDEEAVAALHARALFGARVAIKAGAHPMLADYAAAFIGWDAAQRARFRAGQAAFGASRQAAKAGDHEAALAKGTECLDLAEALGDWWGMAMGLSAQGQALVALDRHAEALAALARARQIHYDLGLFSSGVGNLDAMIEVCGALQRNSLLEELARQRLVIAHEAGDEETADRMLELIAEARGQRGLNVGADQPGSIGVRGR
jgi:hypothetical protein